MSLDALDAFEAHYMFEDKNAWRHEVWVGVQCAEGH
jgi:hypothetical protein